MKYLSLFCLALLLTITSCQKDEPEVNNLIHYDGENNTAPIFQAGILEPAVFFPPSETSEFVGRQIIAIDIVVYTPPETGSVRIYDGTSSNPGNVLREISFNGSDLTPNAWNRFSLSDPVTIGNENIWVGFRFGLANATQVIGCDSGPRANGGDWLFEDSDNVFRTFQDRANENINWNIRAVVSEQ